MKNQYKDSETFNESMKKADDQISSMFAVKSGSYTQGYRRLAEVESILLKDKPVLMNDVSAVRAFFVRMLLVKLVRFCDHIMTHKGHRDSALDLAVYAKMLLAFELDVEAGDETK